jgi:predicted nucleic acid-binding protein
MNKNDFTKLIKNCKKICVDTNIFIYQFQIHENYSKLTIELFSLQEKKKTIIISSFVSLIEILAFSELKGKEALINSYKNFLLKTDGIKIVFPDTSISENSARIKRDYGFKLPDSLQLATCLEEKADIFLTNDTKLKTFKEIPVICLKNFI